MAILGHLKNSRIALSLPQLSILMADDIAERTLRRWLVSWVEAGEVKRTGKKRGTRYEFVFPKKIPLLGHHFLKDIPEYRRPALLEQIRDLWTHNSTALEGNTLTLGDTHAVLGLGLTVSGIPLREHQEVVGHAKAIDLLYQSIQEPISKSLIFELHKAVQTDVVRDIYKPIGAWKVEVNGTYAVSSSGKQLFIEYANPVHVDQLMATLIETINTIEPAKITAKNACAYYAKIHMGIVHIHPFWDGNGRLARLLSNIPLLKAGLPPLVIDKSLRREYIECLADYQIALGQLTKTTGIWPDERQLEAFSLFCEKSYSATRELMALR